MTERAPHSDAKPLLSLTGVEAAYGLVRAIRGVSLPAGLLSGGEQQMLAIARAMMGKPRLILMDEPSLGLSPLLTGEIFEIARRLNREQGVAILLVEQNVGKALELANRAYVLV